MYKNVPVIGVRREIDKLGRICIPIELRRLYHLEGEVEIVATGDGVLIKNLEYTFVKKEDLK